MTIPTASDPAIEIVHRLDAAARRHTTPCGDGVLHWRVWGSGQPLVFFHGGFGSWMHWIRNIEPMAERYRVICVDLPGLGESDYPPEPVTPQSLGQILADGLVQMLEPEERAHLVGFSFGGLCSGQVCALLGERIKSLTLVGASGLGLQRKPLELIRRSDDMTPEQVEQALRHNAMALMLYREDSLDELGFYIHITNDANARLRSRRHSLGDSLRKVLPDVSARLNGIWGEFDITAVGYMQERIDLLTELHPETDFRLIPGSGHWVQYEDHELFNQTLCDLLGKCA
ncbi:MAG: alpha/beta fold hydrolase [Gammaproteobacteria bacterium]|nr:alpha/beta fold hydrolase [Gammaproteobacteria bacterium]